MMVTFFRYEGAARHRPAGSWMFLTTHTGQRSATISCPGCGRIGKLEDYHIGADGRVSPGISCPNGCGFHDYALLSKWEA